MRNGRDVDELCGRRIGGRNEVATRVSDGNDRRLQDLTPLLFELC